MSTEGSVRIAFSYAPGDRQERERIGKFLAGLRRRTNLIEVDLGALPIGAGQRDAVRREIEAADVIVVLLSAEYLANEETYGGHLTLALERGELGQAHIVPIKVTPVNLDGLAIGGLVRLPRFEASISTAPDADTVLVEISDEIAKLVEHVTARIGAESISQTRVDNYRPRRILLTFANPRIVGRDSNISVGKECDELGEVLRSSPRSFEVCTLSGASRASITSALTRHRPDLVHVGAHFSDRGELLLEHTTTNEPDPLDPVELLELLTASKDLVPRCLFLNTCHSALFSLMARSCIEHVVALWGSTRDRAARCYARGFYAAIACGESVTVAHDAGLRELRTTDQARSAMPVYHRRDDSRVVVHRL